MNRNRVTIPRDMLQRGYLIITLLVFGSVFFILLSAFLTSIIVQLNVARDNYHAEKALHIAEAGLEYYKWFLAHFPGEIQHNTGGPGPYVREFRDPEGDVVGEYSLDITGTEFCGEVGRIDITSTGRVHAGGPPRTVYGRYARPSIAEYSFIINSNVWAGFNLDITGPYHSNGFIRMSGTNFSIVTSQQDDWVCNNASLNCSGADDDGTIVSEGDTIGGIFGEGPNRHLWTYPTTGINFGNLLLNLSDMEARAADSGILIPPDPTAAGYRVTFNGDDTVTVEPVTATVSHNEYSSEVGDTYTANNIIGTVGAATTYTLPSDCPVIFIQDKVWLRGEVDQRVTLAAAHPTATSSVPSIIIQDNITYSDDQAGFLALAEGDVLLGVDVPNDLTINGIFVAQTGKFGRNHYETLPSGYGTYRFRDNLTVNGTIVSNGRVGTQWVSGDTPISGFLNRVSAYDRNLVDDPPPLTPRTSTTYRFIEWREIRND